MTNIFWVLGIVAALILYVISIYNTLQRLKTQIRASIQEIGNQLKRQASLIPNLESVVKTYLKHEKGIFEILAEARKAVAKADQSGSAEDIDRAITSVHKLVSQISLVVEDNPELKSNESVNKFMSELTDTADKLMYARRALIDLTQSYNEKLVTVPSNMVASIFGFKPEKGLQTPETGPHVEVDQEEMKDIKVDLEK